MSDFITAITRAPEWAFIAFHLIAITSLLEAVFRSNYSDNVDIGSRLILFFVVVAWGDIRSRLDTCTEAKE